MLHNENLRMHLKGWIDQVCFTRVIILSHLSNFVGFFQIKLANLLPEGSKERKDCIYGFCRKFAPSDVTEDDLLHYSSTLINDKVFLCYVFAKFRFMQSL